MSLPRSITPAERQVVELLWADKRVKQIARLLGVTVPTVRTQIRSAAAKLPNPHGLPAVSLIRSFDDHDYYPSVELRDTREEADALATEWKKDDDREGMGSSYGRKGQPAKRVIVVAEIVATIELTPRDESGRPLT
jgi:hypothetical protein